MRTSKEKDDFIKEKMFSDKERELNDQCKSHQNEIKMLNKRLDDKNREIN